MREGDERRQRLRPEKAGCVPVRQDANNDWQVLLVQSRWTENVWAFPKGGVEAGETTIQAAVRETAEEGGVTGETYVKLGAWCFERNGRHEQRMWLMLVHTEYDAQDWRWSERLFRERAWFSFDDARSLLVRRVGESCRPELIQMLEAAHQAVSHLQCLDTSKPIVHLAPPLEQHELVQRDIAQQDLVQHDLVHHDDSS